MIFLLLIFISIVLTHPCENNCVLQSSYWRQYHYFSKEREKAILWPFKCKREGSISETNLIFDIGIHWHDIMMSNAKDKCTVAAQELITAHLNLCNGGCATPSLSGSILVMEEILSSTCPSGIWNESVSGKHRVIFGFRKSLRELVSFNTGRLINPVCENRYTVDCNNNTISDWCELNPATLVNACDTLGRVTKSIAMTCKKKGISEQQFCDSIKTYTPASDCNGNGILDSCEILSSSDLKCTSRLCIGKKTIERTPIPCLSCKSDDENKNGIIDLCETSTKAMTHFLSEDCNMNNVDDTVDILLHNSVDTNNNLIPDECEIGSCCRELGVCEETSIDKCVGEYFLLGQRCEDRFDCTKIVENEVIGSCCARNDVENSYPVCVPYTSVESCARMKGYFSRFGCSHAMCANSVGSCSSPSSDSCVEGVSWSSCKDLYKPFIFDFHTCSSEENIIMSNYSSRGTCILKKRCWNNITKDDCDNLAGKFDFISCEYRKDYAERTEGTCKVDGIVKNHYSNRECEFLGGKFGVKRENEISNQEICCYDQFDHACFPWKDEFCTEKPRQRIKCSDNVLCPLSEGIGKGCCITNNVTEVKLEENTCKLFSSVWLNKLDCFKHRFNTSFLGYNDRIVIEINNSTNVTVNVDDDDSDNNPYYYSVVTPIFLLFFIGFFFFLMWWYV